MGQCFPLRKRAWWRCPKCGSVSPKRRAAQPSPAVTPQCTHNGGDLSEDCAIAAAATGPRTIGGVCPFFLAGHCRLGERCKMPHTEPDANAAVCPPLSDARINAALPQSQCGTPSCAAVDGEECAVCLEVFHLGDEVRTTPCHHAFHPHCIDNWLRRQHQQNAPPSNRAGEHCAYSCPACTACIAFPEVDAPSTHGAKPAENENDRSRPLEPPPIDPCPSP